MKTFFKQNYSHSCHTRFAVFFLLPSCCISSLLLKYKPDQLCVIMSLSIVTDLFYKKHDITRRILMLIILNKRLEGLREAHSVPDIHTGHSY